MTTCAMPCSLERKEDGNRTYSVLKRVCNIESYDYDLSPNPLHYSTLRSFTDKIIVTMKKHCLIALVCLAVLGCVEASQWPPTPAVCLGPQAGGGGQNCSAERPDTMPPVYTAAPVFVRSVPNGKRYLGGTGNDTFHVVHLYSETDDLYEMGYALGQLFPNEIADMFSKIEPWLEGLLEKAVPWLPEWLADLVVEAGAPVALDFIYDVTEKYIPADYLREWAGMAAGANCSVKRIQRVSLFPQLSKAACTLFLSNKDATLNNTGYHLRALDFDPTSYVADFSTLFIYHYNSKPKLANWGWIAMTGCLSCMNNVPITVSEKKWGGHDALIPFGFPWMQMLRKSLELDNIDAINKFVLSVDQANSSTPQTVAIHIGYCDQRDKEIVGYEIGYNYTQTFHWNSFPNVSTFPGWKDIVLWPKNAWPTTTCVKEMVDAQYGKIDADWMANYYSPNDMTGDTHVVGIDLNNMKVFFANSRKSTSGGPLCAYYRQRTLLDMNALFNETL